MPVRDTVSRKRQRELEGLSPFELKDTLIKLAGENCERQAVTMLNAGRGNPNWTATEPREAFFLLGTFGLAESRLAWDEWDGVGGMPSKPGISERFAAFLKENRNEHGADLLKRSLDYATKTLGMDADTFVHELAPARPPRAPQRVKCAIEPTRPCHNAHEMRRYGLTTGLAAHSKEPTGVDRQRAPRRRTAGNQDPRTAER